MCAEIYSHYPLAKCSCCVAGGGDCHCESGNKNAVFHENKTETFVSHDCASESVVCHSFGIEIATDGGGNGVWVKGNLE